MSEYMQVKLPFECISEHATNLGKDGWRLINILRTDQMPTGTVLCVLERTKKPAKK